MHVRDDRSHLLRPLRKAGLSPAFISWEIGRGDGLAFIAVCRMAWRSKAQILCSCTYSSTVGGPSIPEMYTYHSVVDEAEL